MSCIAAFLFRVLKALEALTNKHPVCTTQEGGCEAATHAMRLYIPGCQHQIAMAL